MIIAVDFDGTIVENRYPAIGHEIPFAVRTLKMLQEEGHFLILWSCREEEELDAALDWCRERGLEFYAVNKDFPEENEKENLSFTRKIKADMFIDDRNVGGLPDWGAIYQMIHENKTYEDIISERDRSEHQEYTYDNLPKKKWWQF
jgi:hypothetical protein